MDQEKQRVIELVEEKGIDLTELANKIEFDPILLKLYLTKDDYPVPKRILKKVEEAILN